ncbi:MAG: hypothetical protein ACXWNZ_05605 [Vulcanimicrobiaceae bacterium]
MHVTRGVFGEPRLGIDVTIGGTSIRVLFDTGSAGLRVVASAVSSNSTRRTGVPAGGGYGTGLILQGEEATATLAIGDAHTDGDAGVELVNGFSCSAQRPECPAANGGTPEMFGRLFPGILGAGNIEPALGRCCDNPLKAFEDGVGRTYIVHSNFAAPTLTLNPDSAEKSAFTMVDVGVMATPPSGCFTISDTKICGDVIFDTGTPQLVVTTNGALPTGPTRGTSMTLAIGRWSHEYALGAGSPPVRLVMQRGMTNRTVVGLAALQDIDVLYDLDAGRIGLLNR